MTNRCSEDFSVQGPATQCHQHNTQYQQIKVPNDNQHQNQSNSLAIHPNINRGRTPEIDERKWSEEHQRAVLLRTYISAVQARIYVPPFNSMVESFLPLGACQNSSLVDRYSRACGEGERSKFVPICFQIYNLCACVSSKGSKFWRSTVAAERVVCLSVCLSVRLYSRTTGNEAAYERYQQL